MCQGCYVDEYGGSTDLPENVEEIVDLIRELYSLPKCSLGGPLHVAIEDFNIEDHHWKPFQYEPDPYPDEALRISLEICILMKPLTLSQRAAVLASFEGWI